MSRRFIDSQDGETAISIPAGGTTVAEASFISLEHFAQECSIIAPDYPRLAT
jgi:hypothetical protein